MKKLFITAIVLTMTLSVNAQKWWGNEKVKGNGKATTITRSIGDYDGVSLAGFFDVVLVKGKEGKIKIEGEENLMEYIVTEVKRGNLQIKVKKGVNLKTTKRLTVTVPVQSIDQVSLGGSGNIEGNVLIKTDDLSVNLGGSGNITLSLDATTVKTSIGGSGNINLSGDADSLKGSIAGSGTIKAYNLQVNSMKASIAGSGDIRISVKNEIKATIAGSGSVYYKGSPKVNKTTIGSGSVKSRN